MRISDWSSDVCSSDLLLPLLSLSFPRDHQAAARAAAPLGLSMELDDREAGYAGAGCGDQAGNSDLSQAALLLERIARGCGACRYRYECTECHAVSRRRAGRLDRKRVV